MFLIAVCEHVSWQLILVQQLQELTIPILKLTNCESNLLITLYRDKTLKWPIQQNSLLCTFWNSTYWQCCKLLKWSWLYLLVFWFFSVFLFFPTKTYLHDLFSPCDWCILAGLIMHKTDKPVYKSYLKRTFLDSYSGVPYTDITFQASLTVLQIWLLSYNFFLILSISLFSKFKKINIIGFSMKSDYIINVK